MNIIYQQLYFPKISYLLCVCLSSCEFTHRLSFMPFFPCQFFGHCWFSFYLWVWEFLFTILKELLLHIPGTFGGWEWNVTDCESHLPSLCEALPSCKGHSSLLLPVPKAPPLPSLPPIAFCLSNTFANYSAKNQDGTKGQPASLHNLALSLG